MDICTSLTFPFDCSLSWHFKVGTFVVSIKSMISVKIGLLIKYAFCLLMWQPAPVALRRGIGGIRQYFLRNLQCVWGSSDPTGDLRWFPVTYKLLLLSGATVLLQNHKYTDWWLVCVVFLQYKVKWARSECDITGWLTKLGNKKMGYSARLRRQGKNLLQWQHLFYTYFYVWFCRVVFMS